MSAPVISKKRDLWVPYKEGEEELMILLASGLHEFAIHAADAVATEAPPSSKRPDRPIPYQRSIRASTYLRGQLFSGYDVANVRDQRRKLYSVIYTTSRLGHFLEFGTLPHPMDFIAVPGKGVFHRRWQHPGAGRRPHFVKGVLKAMSRVQSEMAAGMKLGKVRINSRARVTSTARPTP